LIAKFAAWVERSPTTVVIVRASGRSSTPQPIDGVLQAFHAVS